MLSYKQKIHYLLKCVRRLNDEEFVYHVLNGEYNPTEFYIQQRGSCYPGKLLFYIGTVAKNCGFFDQHHQLLELLYTADRFGMQPVVFYGEDYLYYDADYSKAIDNQNAFEYYFDPIGYDIYSNFDKANNIIYAQSNHRVYSWNRDDLLENYSLYPNRKRFGLEEKPDPNIYIERLAKMQNKYVSLNECVKKKMNYDTKELLSDKRLIGVHARGTDFKTGFKNCAKIVPPEMHLEEVKHLMDKYDGVFLATDNEETIKLFEAYLGNRLYYYKDVYRSKDNKEGIHYSHDSRKNHKFLLGYEVLRDMYTLSQTTALVAGHSGVSSMAQIQKLADGQNYEDLKIIDLGRN